MKKSILIILLILPLLGVAQKDNFNISQIYPIERSHSFVGFTVEYMGYARVRGRFENFNGSFRYDENDISKTSVSLQIDVESIDTDLDFRDKDLKSDNWFAAETYPIIQFTSTKVEESKDGLSVTGDLTIKDVTKQVVLHLNKPSGILKDSRGDNQVIFSGSLVLNRKEFGVAGDNWSRVREGITAVSDEVKIEFTALGKQILKENFANWVRNKERPHGLIYSIYKEEGIELAIEKFHELIKAQETNINAGTLNTVGYVMLKEGKVEDALTIFKTNLEAFPDNANILDSYAEALATNKNWIEARKYYEIAVEKNADNMNAIEILKHI